MECRERFEHHADAVLVEHVTVRFDDRVALDDATAQFGRGIVHTLTGSNGSGKTTLLGVIAGLVTPHHGALRGRPQKLAYMPQHTAAGDRLPITAREVVAMGRWAVRGLWRPLTRSDHELVASSLRRVGAEHLAAAQLVELSGGERQRVLLAQVLTQRATLLLLDEPTASADAESRDRIDAILWEEAERGATVIVATHDVEAIARAGRVLTLHNGRILARPN